MPDIRRRCNVGQLGKPSGHDECMNNKIYSESFIETILPTIWS